MREHVISSTQSGRPSIASVLLATLVSVVAFEGNASTFDFSIGDAAIEGVSNTTLIGGVAVRVESPDQRMIAKGHLDPNVCGRGPDGRLYYQVCQGIFKDQVFPAERLAQAPGYGSSNFDQGNLNYKRGDITQSGLRVNQDLQLTWGDFGFFAKGFAFYDPANDNFTEYHPNYLTSDNIDDVGYLSLPGNEIIRAGGIPQALTVLGPLANQLGLNPLLANPLAIPVLGVRTDSRACPENRNPDAQPCGVVYGPGGTVRSRRSDRETLDLVGRGLILQDLNIYGFFQLPGERELGIKLGRQQVQWGEATIEFFDSLNVANAPDLSNLFRLGGNGLDDFYQPVNMLSVFATLFEGASISAFYQLEWQPLVTPAAGSFYSPINVGTNNDGPDFVTTGFGQLPHDPEGLGYELDSPLTAITNTSSRIPRLADREPDWRNQFGVQFKYYAPDFNNGTDIGLYYASYHARTPIASFYSTDESCAKNTTNPAALVLACPDLPLLHAILSPNDPAGARSDALALDTAAVVLEYPENIQLYGLSFNTSFGDVAVQGELAYRPNQPLQVALVDLAFAAYGPTLTNCHIAPGCLGSNVGLGVMPDGSIGIFGSSDYRGADGRPGAFADTYDAVVGALPGSGRSFPSFVIPYRGGVVGMNPANSYIRGWEEFQTLSFNFGSTYVEGNTDLVAHLVGADQIIWLFELGGYWVPEMPSLDRLQLEAPGVEYHASAGADGSGADGSRQACSTNVACNVGPDGLRFNPHQQDRELYPDEISLGYSVVALVRYESVMPNISIQPQIIFKHDFYNTTPGLASNYIDGRIIWDTGVEVRYRERMSFNLGYRFMAGGGVANQFADRDEARVFLKYAF
ncbi:MAG: DUF1302 domain-containing protein [Pseudomonadota bacterium]|nr:DUF1302 domain-containing protein [Pseudomonadota bacterium]